MKRAVFTAWLISLLFAGCDKVFLEADSDASASRDLSADMTADSAPDSGQTDSGRQTLGRQISPQIPGRQIRQWATRGQTHQPDTAAR
jgi:hypothetical protein